MQNPSNSTSLKCYSCMLCVIVIISSFTRTFADNTFMSSRILNARHLLVMEYFSFVVLTHLPKLRLRVLLPYQVIVDYNAVCVCPSTLFTCMQKQNQVCKFPFFGHSVHSILYTHIYIHIQRARERESKREFDRG